MSLTSSPSSTSNTWLGSFSVFIPLLQDRKRSLHQTLQIALQNLWQKKSKTGIPGQRPEISRVGLVIIVDDVPVGVVHLNALPKSVSIAQLLNHMIRKTSKYEKQENVISYFISQESCRLCCCFGIARFCSILTSLANRLFASFSAFWGTEGTMVLLWRSICAS